MYQRVARHPTSNHELATSWSGRSPPAFYEFMSTNHPFARAMVHLFAGGSTEELDRLRNSS